MSEEDLQTESSDDDEDETEVPEETAMTEDDNHGDNVTDTSDLQQDSEELKPEDAEKDSSCTDKSGNQPTSTNDGNAESPDLNVILDIPVALAHLAVVKRAAFGQRQNQKEGVLGHGDGIGRADDGQRNACRRQG